MRFKNKQTEMIFYLGLKSNGSFYGVEFFSYLEDFLGSEAHHLPKAQYNFYFLKHKEGVFVVSATTARLRALKIIDANFISQDLINLYGHIIKLDKNSYGGVYKIYNRWESL